MWPKESQRQGFCLQLGHSFKKPKGLSVMVAKERITTDSQRKNLHGQTIRPAFCTWRLSFLPSPLTGKDALCLWQAGQCSAERNLHVSASFMHKCSGPSISGTEPRGRQWGRGQADTWGWRPTTTLEEYGFTGHVCLRCPICKYK